MLIPQLCWRESYSSDVVWGNEIPIKLQVVNSPERVIVLRCETCSERENLLIYSRFRIVTRKEH